MSESAGLGWFAQTEVFFAVALECYRKVDGRRDFHDWATITPFICGDDNFSVPLGRTVSGLPKVLSRVKHPPRQTLLRMDAEVWAALETGQQALVQPVVEIVQHEDNAGLGHPDTQDMAFGCSELLCLKLGTKKGSQLKYPGRSQPARAGAGTAGQPGALVDVVAEAVDEPPAQTLQSRQPARRGCFRSVTLALPTAQVLRFLPAGALGQALSALTGRRDASPDGHN